MKRLKKVLIDVLEIDKNLISDKLNLQDAENWDSMTMLYLVVALEKTFDIKFTTADATNMQFVEDIKRILEEKNVSLDE